MPALANVLHNADTRRTTRISTRAFRVVMIGVLLWLGLGSVTDLLGAPPTRRGSAPMTAAEGGELVGILTHFEYNWTKINGPQPDTRLSLKAEGEADPVDYLLALPNEAVDPNLELSLRKVYPSNTVAMKWEMRDGKRLVTKIAVLTPTSGQGTMPGIVTARDKGYLDLKSGGRPPLTVRYVVPWDARANGPTPAVADSLERLAVGDKVIVTWSANPERLWVHQVTLVARAPVSKPAGNEKSGKAP